MNDIFEKNLSALEKKNPELAQQVLLAEPEPIEVEDTKSGHRTFKYKGIYFHSKYDPVTEAQRQLDEALRARPGNLTLSDIDWCIFYGMGLGYAASGALEGGVKDVMVYEPSPPGVLKSIFCVHDMTGLFSDKGFFVTTDMKQAIDEVSEKSDDINRVISCETNVYKRVFADDYAGYARGVNAAYANAILNVRTFVSSNWTWLENYLRNVKNYLRFPVIDVLKDRFKDIPLILVGAGPSLAKNMHLLKTFKGRAVILAAVTAYLPMIRRGIVPDFVIAAEMYDMGKFFSGAECDNQTRLILADIAHPNLYERECKGKVYYFSEFLRFASELSPFLGSGYAPPSGGSVTTVALDMAGFFGCNPIVMIGQDLSYGENKTHVSGSVYGVQEVSVKDGGRIAVKTETHTDDRIHEGEYRLQKLRGYYGGMVNSNDAWITFHKWFEEYMVHLKDAAPEIKVINATEGGAYIEGMEHIPLAEVMERYIDANRGPYVEAMIDEAMLARGDVDYAGMSAYFSGLLDSIRKMSQCAKKLNAETAGLERMLDGTGIKVDMMPAIKRIKRLENRMFDTAEHALFILDAIFAHHHRLRAYLKKDMSDDVEKQFRADLGATRQTHGAVLKACSAFAPLIEDALAVVRSAQGASMPEARAELGQDI